MSQKKQKSFVDRRFALSKKEMAKYRAVYTVQVERGDGTNASHRIAMVGVGYLGKNLLRTFTSLNFLTRFFGVACDSRSKIDSQYSNATGLDKIEALPGDTTILAAAMATLAATHVDWVERALDAGKHIYREAIFLQTTVDEKKRALVVEHLLTRNLAFQTVWKTTRNRGLCESGRALATFGALIKHMPQSNLRFGKPH